MEKSLEESKSALVKAKDDIERYYNQCWTPALEYHTRDWVFLDASDIKTTCPLSKLAERYLGPYVVQQRVVKMHTNSNSLHL